RWLHFSVRLVRWIMNKLYDVLEICLQELENGSDLESVLARYPDLAGELHPILNASIKARTRSAAVSAPSPEVMRRGRARLLQRASEMREAKIAPRRRMIPLFQRLAISFSLTALFLASGTGLVGASSSALPGENLYPVKRTWEDLRLFFTFNSDRKEILESEFEGERLDEVGELLAEGRHETIQYAGIFMQVNGVTYVSGVKVLIPANLQVPANGAAVVITGRTNAQGFVEIESIELLPAGAIVPVGEPLEVENESGSGSNSEDGAGSGSGNEAQGNGASATPEPIRRFFEMTGTVELISNNLLVINGHTVYLGNAKIDGVLKPGVNVEIEGYYAADGSFIVTEVKVKDSGTGSGGSNENSGSDSDLNSGSNSNDDSSSKSNDNSNSNDDTSGSGGDDGGDDSNDNNDNY
ncbi:MAG: DUF5667 domain-containing protein, partial [Anaerolineales bacterium]|nr:DUF5667 domain-containing protein [Anaerolineales bacterium]